MRKSPGTCHVVEPASAKGTNGVGSDARKSRIMKGMKREAILFLKTAALLSFCPRKYLTFEKYCSISVGEWSVQPLPDSIVCVAERRFW